MLRQRIDHALERERALARGLKEVATELRLIDVVDLVAYIRNEQFANVGDLVNSSIELYFKPGTLRYGEAGEVDLQWGSVPSVSFDMSFEHREVSVHFRLLLAAMHAGVDINYITFAGNRRDPNENTERLVAALADARLDRSRPSLI